MLIKSVICVHLCLKSGGWALDQLRITNNELRIGERRNRDRKRGNHRFNQLPITNYELPIEKKKP